ncbi:hypothetical protein [Harryflintia acetispora]|uniref:hypothetical protein n=1 Tax=Harryflintia acetispora TaxID=1849041 RepID=UPI001898912E|nr:hypothetical protein [Harryflintia acetispora]
MKKCKILAVTIFSLLGISLLGGFTLGDSGAREHYAGLLREGIITGAEFMVGSISAEMQLPADAGGPPHGGNHPPMDPLTLRGGISVGESEKEPLDDFVIGEITQGREAGEPA